MIWRSFGMPYGLDDIDRMKGLSEQYTDLKRKKKGIHTYPLEPKPSDELALGIAFGLEHALQLDEDGLSADLDEEWRLIWMSELWLGGVGAEEVRRDVDVDAHGG